MMYGSVLVAMVMALVALEYGGPTPAAPPSVVLSEMTLLTGAVLAAGLAISAYIFLRQKRLETDEQRFFRTVGLMGKLYRLAVVGAYGVMLFVFGWPAVAARWIGLESWQTPQLLALLAPLLVLWLVSWVALYAADKRLRATIFARLGVEAGQGGWTLPRYVVFQLRQYILVVLAPLVALIGFLDLAGHAVGGDVAGAMVLPMFAVAALLSGPWLRFCWRTEPMPATDARRRLEELTERAHVRVGEILVWRTNVSIANGAMVGLVGPLRYIMITDALLVSLPAREIEAVFAHEVAHARYHHVLLYMAVAVAAMAGAVVGGELAALAAYEWLGEAWIEDASIVGGVGMILLHWILIFGYLSRRCELEADLYGARATSCDAHEGGPPAETALAPDLPWQPACLPLNAAKRVGHMPPEERGLCAYRVNVFTTALRRIARLNGAAERAGGWRHFSILRRREFLEALLADPDQVPRFERRMRLLKALALGWCGLMVVLAAVLTFMPLG